MKNIILLLLLLVHDICCNDDSFLSKFHQNKFKIKDERVQLMRYNKSFFKFFEAKAFKFNRTTTAHNGSWNFKIDVYDKLEAVLQAYIFLGNQYRLSSMRFQVNLKKAVDADVIGMRRIKECGNATTFYFHKDITYYYCNFVLDASRFPPLIPEGKYRFDVANFYSNTELYMFSIFLEIYIPFEYPKNKHG